MLRYKTKTRPGLVTLYDIRPGNVVGLSTRSLHGANRMQVNSELTKRRLGNHDGTLWQHRHHRGRYCVVEKLWHPSPVSYQPSLAAASTVRHTEPHLDNRTTYRYFTDWYKADLLENYWHCCRKKVTCGWLDVSASWIQLLLGWSWRPHNV